MAKSAPKDQWRTVRRYALAGEREKARRLLERMVQQYPDDPDAAAELQRLQNNQALLCTESKRQRKLRNVESALLALADDVAAHGSAHKLAAMPTEQLTRLHRALLAGLRTLKDAKTPAPTGTNAYKKALERELSRRRKKNVRAKLIVAGTLLSALLLVGGAAWALHSRAAALCSQLDEACSAQDWERAAALLEAVDTGINRLMYSRTWETTARVQNWQQYSIARAAELSTRLHIYEKREAISTLSLEERADFLRRIRALPAHFSRGLLAHWDELCRPEREKLDAQRDAIVAEVEAAAAAPTLTGDVVGDTARLRKAKGQLSRVITTFGNAQETFGLPAEHIVPCKMLLAQVEAYLADIDILNRAEMQLRSARTYSQHLNALREIAPRQYPPALAAAKAGQALPTEDFICNTVRAARFKIPLEMPQAVINAVVNKGPSFCTGYPAGIEQLHLMEDIFTSRVFRQRVYEVFRANGEVHYTDQPPLVHTDKNSVTFTLSELDPERKVSKSPHLEWPNAHAVWIRTIDATPILKATGIARETFFLSANLPETLAKITAIHDKDCPALAKAYAYHILLEVMKLHKSDILGLRFSPLLQEDIQSFQLMLSHCKIKPSVTGWLSRKNEALAAETLCEQWFNAHADRDYNTEMSRTLSRILHTRPRYLGYITAHGQPRLLKPAVDGAKLWYLSDGQLISTPCGQPLRNPAPYSPVFEE